MVNEAFDLALTTNFHVHGVPFEVLEAAPPFAGTFEIDEHISIRTIERDLADQMFDACLPGSCKGATRQFDAAYGYVAPRFPGDDDNKFDPRGKITRTMALARLIHPTCDTFAFAGIVSANGDSARPRLIRSFTGPRPHAFVFDSERRSWLTASDLASVRDLCLQCDEEKLPRRVKRALWHHEYAACIYYGEIRAASMTTALEVLLGTSSKSSTKQFIQRVPQLADELDVPDLDRSRASQAWGLRSSVAHGGEKLMTRELGVTFDRVQRLIAAIIRRAVEDPAFAAILSVDDAMNAKWPVT